MKPSNNEINNALRSIEATERPADHPRVLAAKAIVSRRVRMTPQLTQRMIDSGSETEERRRRFISSSVKWSKRSLWSRLLGR